MKVAADTTRASVTFQVPRTEVNTTCHLAWSHIVTKVVLGGVSQGPQCAVCAACFALLQLHQDAVGLVKQDVVRALGRKEGKADLPVAIRNLATELMMFGAVGHGPAPEGHGSFCVWAQKGPWRGVPPSPSALRL